MLGIEDQRRTVKEMLKEVALRYFAEHAVKFVFSAGDRGVRHHGRDAFMVAVK